MIREMLFRCWSPKNKEMFEVGRLGFEGDKVRIYPKGWEGYTSSVIEDGILMEYSGLKDKNNNKIFEGDKVKAYGEIYTIEFELGSFIFVRKEIVKHHTNEYKLNWRSVSNNAGDYREWEECRNNYEVIKNIYKEEK